MHWIHIDSYRRRFDAIISIPTYVSFSKSLVWTSDGCEAKCFSHFHVRKNMLCTHQKPPRLFQMVRQRVLLILSCVFFPLSITNITNILSNQNQLLYVSYPSNICDHGASPLCPKSG